MRSPFDRTIRRRFAASWAPIQRRAALAIAAVICLLGGMLATPPLAHAERADRDKPLNFESDNASYDDLHQQTVLTGHVILTKGTIIIRADRVEVRQDPQGYQFATATVTGAAPASFRQKREGLDEYVEGTGRHIDYDGKNDVTVLTTQAVVRRLSGTSTMLDEVHGSVIRYDGQNDVYTANSGRDNAGPGNPSGRVRGTLAPRTDVGGATSPAAATISPGRP